MTKASDTQVGGDHYRTMGDFQPWDVLKHWLTPEEYRGYQKGVAIAYLARERQKGGDQDVAKAAHHLQKLIEVLAEHKSADKPVRGPLEAVVTACCGNFETCTQPCVPRAVLRADANGWMAWTGGLSPVPDTVLVEVRLKNGELKRADAGLLAWSHLDMGSDIAAYRIIHTTN